MLYAPPIHRPPALHSMASIIVPRRDESHRKDDRFKDDRFDVMTTTIPSPLEVGDTAYPLRSSLNGAFYPGSGHGVGEFIVQELFPEFVGQGRNLNDAFLDWRNKVHCQFQDLYAKRPFEMTQQEKTVWQILGSQIDVTAYRAGTPISIRQIGRVGTHARPHPDTLEWENGRKERVRLDQMPGEFAAYKPGQPFEAIVARDPVDFRLLKVTHIHRIRSLPRMSAEEFSDLLQSIPTTSALPEASWD